MSTSAIPVHVGLVDQTGEVASELPGLAAALNEQVHDEFFKDWGVVASVGAYTSSQLPSGCWAVYVRAKLDEPGALGYHTDNHNQPVSYVELTDTWTVTVGHETLEMLADPWGNRMHAAELPQGIDPSQVGLSSASDRVQYLVEVCDPCEHTSYRVGGYDLSDYLLPRYYRTQPGRNRWFSHTGALTEPREVADGGYVSFARTDGEWFQVFNQGGSLQVSDLGLYESVKFGSLREFTDYHAQADRTNGK